MKGMQELVAEMDFMKTSEEFNGEKEEYGHMEKVIGYSKDFHHLITISNMGKFYCLRMEIQIQNIRE